MPRRSCWLLVPDLPKFVTGGFDALVGGETK
jgi:hypothetical protein